MGRQGEIGHGARQQHEQHQAQSDAKPIPEHCVVAHVGGTGQLGQKRGHHRHRKQAVGELEEQIGIRIRRQAPVGGRPVGQSQQHDQAGLVDDHVGQGPPRQHHNAPNGGIAEVRVPAQGNLGGPHGRNEHQCHGYDAKRCTRSQQPQLEGVGQHTVHGWLTTSHSAHGQQHEDHHHVVDRRCECCCSKPASGVEEC